MLPAVKHPTHIIRNNLLSGLHRVLSCRVAGAVDVSFLAETPPKQNQARVPHFIPPKQEAAMRFQPYGGLRCEYLAKKLHFMVGMGADMPVHNKIICDLSG